MRRVVGVAALWLLGCTRGPTAMGERAQATVPVAAEAAEAAMSQQKVLAWAVARFGVPAAEIEVLPLADVAGGGVVYGVRTGQQPKRAAPTPVLLAGGELYAGPDGFARWAKSTDRTDATTVATAAAFLVFGARSEPIGVDGDDEGYAAPALDGDGRVVFWYREPAKGGARQGMASFRPDGTVTVE